MQLLLVRHGESIKNIEDRHGGSGAPLTPTGVEQILNMCAHVKKVYGQPSAVFYSNRIHVQESAEMISSLFQVPLLHDPRIEPMYLGVLDGLSRVEAARLHPRAAASLEQWRETGRDLDKLEI